MLGNEIGLANRIVKCSIPQEVAALAVGGAEVEGQSPLSPDLVEAQAEASDLVELLEDPADVRWAARWPFGKLLKTWEFWVIFDCVCVCV